MELTEQEVTEIRRANDELKSLKETESNLRKLIANAVSMFRDKAKVHEDLANQMYTLASALEDKARSL